MLEEEQRGLIKMWKAKAEEMRKKNPASYAAKKEQLRRSSLTVAAPHRHHMQYLPQKVRKVKRRRVRDSFQPCLRCGGEWVNIIRNRRIEGSHSIAANCCRSSRSYLESNGEVSVSFIIIYSQEIHRKT